MKLKFAAIIPYRLSQNQNIDASAVDWPADGPTRESSELVFPQCENWCCRGGSRARRYESVPTTPCYALCIYVTIAGALLVRACAAGAPLVRACLASRLASETLLYTAYIGKSKK